MFYESIKASGMGDSFLYTALDCITWSASVSVAEARANGQIPACLCYGQRESCWVTARFTAVDKVEKLHVIMHCFGGTE